MWFVNTDDVAEVVGAEPKADRGFGRKYLAQLNPTSPITLIGQFSLSRSTPPSRDEFYIAGYPGVTIVSTFLDDASRLSELPASLLNSVPADNTYVFAKGCEGTFAGFAHFVGTTVRRSFTASRTTVLENIGPAENFESLYWSGLRKNRRGEEGALPFEPAELTDAAQAEWLGMVVAPDGPGINVVAYAVDGRPEPRVAPRTKNEPIKEIAAQVSSPQSHYDDYENTPEEESSGDEFAKLADASAAAAKRVGRGVKRRATKLGSTAADRIRHADRWRSPVSAARAGVRKMRLPRKWRR